MADKKISQLTALSAANLAPSTDVLAIVDTSATETKKIVAQDLINGVLNVASAVGIGTASPAGKLHVAGQARIQDSASASNYILIGSGANASRGGNSVMAQTGSMVMGTEAASNLIFITNAAESARFDSSGNLGLGVTPSNWPGQAANYDVLQAGLSAFANVADLQAEVSYNQYVESGTGTRKYITSNPALFYRIGNTGHSWHTNSNTPSAGNTATFTQAMTLDADRRLQLNTTTFVGNEQFIIGFSSSGSVTQALNTRDTNASANNNSHIVLRRSDDTYLGSLGRAGTDTAMFVDGNSYLSLRTGGTERGRFTAGGDFELGTNAGTGTRNLTITTNTSGDPTLTLSAAGVDSGQLWYGRADSRLYARSSNTGGVYLASGGTSWTAVSDERKKDIIEPIANAAEKVASLRAVVGKYKTDKDGVRRSFLIAQDVRAVFPEAVDASDENELGLSYTDTIPLLVAAIKELKVELDAAKVKIAALEAK